MYFCRPTPMSVFIMWKLLLNVDTVYADAVLWKSVTQHFRL